jgi:hypothetical protein
MGLIYSDIPELYGSDTEICLSNLKRLELELTEILEKRLAHLTELSDAIISDGEDLDVIKSILLSIKSDGAAEVGSIIEENKDIADDVFSRLSLIERLTVLKEVFTKLNFDRKNLDVVFGKSDESIPASAAERIAYLRNSYNDVAYIQFSSLFTSPRAAYFNNVTDVCESVYNGECEYCILPVETSNSGKLLSFYELILKYGFKITAVYDLYGDDGKEYTRYALLGKRLMINNQGLKHKTRKRYLEFIMTESDTQSLGNIMSAVGFCSMKLRRIDTLSFNTNGDTKNSLLCPVFRVDGSDIKTFIAFLAIDCPDYTPIGLYMQI